ncbi:MAG: S-layer homology domain-containing protein [Clostridia bacterium]|nr:S-layer homology domain-containing protein [Clostridia bacterium]
MKRFLSIMLSVLLLTMTTINVSASNTPSDWALNEVTDAKNEGIITDAVTLDYQANITREQFCELVVLAYQKISGNQATSGNISFNDTQNNEIMKAANLGIVTGYGYGIFAPNDLITREQIATMIVRMIDKAVKSVNINRYKNNSFADLDSISDWALPSVNFAYDNGIMQGVGDNYIAPKANTTCEQAIMLVYNAVKLYANTSSDEDFTDVYAATNYKKILNDNNITDYMYLLPDDYDDDGKAEAYVITGTSTEDEFLTWEMVDAEIYFIDSSDNLYYVETLPTGYARYAGQIVVPNGKFIVVETSTSGISGWSNLYGCNNGKAFIPDISPLNGSIVEENGKYIRLEEDLSTDYGDFTETELGYDENTRQFYEK